MGLFWNKIRVRGPKERLDHRATEHFLMGVNRSILVSHVDKENIIFSPQVKSMVYSVHYTNIYWMIK